MSEFVACPGLFYATSAQDGILSRIRIPGGILTDQQCEAIAQLANQVGDGLLQITNRANVQIRGIQTAIVPDALHHLQQLELASPTTEVDAIRNIMSSPTAGIDRQELLDVRPLVRAWNYHLMNRLDFAVLSPKFSVCFDGGEAVSVRDRPNDISLNAARIGKDVHFRLNLSVGERGDAPNDVGVLIKPEESMEVLTALAAVYRDYTIQQMHGTARQKPRLREMLNDWGVEAYLQAVEHHLPFPLQRSEINCDVSRSDSWGHLGVHSQRQSGFSYIGVVLPLGRLDTSQLQGLAALAQQHGSSTLRLTPWQNVLVTDIPHQQMAKVRERIEQLGLHTSATHPCSAIVACSGSTGCKSAATDTQSHALTLSAHLEQRMKLDRPLNIHFSGCEKSCAQHYPSDIALLGIKQEGIEAYQIYVGNGGSKFGRELCQKYTFEQLPDLIEYMLQTYQNKRHNSNETFKEFVNRQTLSEVNQLFDKHFDDQ